VKSINVHDDDTYALPGRKRNLSLIDHALPGIKLRNLNLGRQYHVHVRVWNTTTA
jgi:hypothetical protein